IRGRGMVAEQQERVAVDDGRAAVAPLKVERRDLLTQMPLPDRLAVDAHRDDLSRAEPRVDERAIARRARRRQVVLVVYRCERTFRFDAMFPQLMTVAVRKGF